MVGLWGRSGRNGGSICLHQPFVPSSYKSEVSEQAEGAAALAFVYLRPWRLPYIKNEVSEEAEGAAPALPPFVPSSLLEVEIYETQYISRVLCQSSQVSISISG